MHIVLDVILIAILAISLILGYKRGFVRSLLGAVSFAAALLAALLLSAPFAGILQEHIVYPAVYKTVDSSFERFDGGEELLALLDDKSAQIHEMLARFGVSERQAAEYAESTVSSEDAAEHSEGVREGFVQMIAEPVAATVSTEIAFISIFLVVLLILFILQIVLDLVTKFPGLHEINQLFGLLLGLVYGGITVCILVSTVSNFWPLLTSVNPAIFPVDAVERSFLFEWISKYNPLSFLLENMV